MKLLTKDTDYAVRALLVLSKNHRLFMSTREISEDRDIPYQFLRRILQKLIKNRLVISKEGKSGGFKINVDPDSIAILDIIRIFQGDIQLSECMFRNKLCDNRATCVLRKEVKRIEKIVDKEFRNITIGTLSHK